MHELSEIVERKFVDSLDVTDWEVLSDDGWHDVTAVHKTVEYDVWRLILEDNFSLECADTHIVIDSNKSQKFVKDLNIGDQILTVNGPKRVVSVEKLSIPPENMYDLTIDSEDHTLFTNGILSHNTTSVAAYLLWCVLFNANFSVAILANKHPMAKEIISRIQMAYENLPFWMQQGVISWNKTDLALENGSTILSSSTTGDSIRGRSVNLVYLDEFAFVPNQIQEVFFTSVYPTISSGKSTKIVITSTPNGLNRFHKIWKDSEDGKNTYARTDVHWSDVPGRDDVWREETIMNTSERQFRQEFGCFHYYSKLRLKINNSHINTTLGRLYEALRSNNMESLIAEQQEESIDDNGAGTT